MKLERVSLKTPDGTESYDGRLSRLTCDCCGQESLLIGSPELIPSISDYLRQELHNLERNIGYYKRSCFSRDRLLIQQRDLQAILDGLTKE